MRATTLLRRSFTYYRRTALVVVLGVAVAVGVLAGALLVGASVRASLRDLFLTRLGKTDVILTRSGFFREELAAALASHGSLETAPLISLTGLLTHQASGRRAGALEVHGVDESFWRFHEIETTAGVLGDREAMLTDAVADELGARHGDTVLLRIERPSPVPGGSLHGEKEDVGRTLRLTVKAWPPEAPELSLQAQQGPVRAVVVPLSRLQEDLEQEHWVNTILVSSENEAVEPALEEVYALEDLGVHVRRLGDRGALSVESEAIVLDDRLAEAVSSSAQELGWRTARILTYLANHMRVGDREVPYSLLSALDPESYRSLASLSGREPLTTSGSPILINDWTARALAAEPGDSLAIEYYVWEQEGRLETETATFQVAGIVPLEGPAADPDLAPRYPGITSARNLGDWDPPFPIDFSRIQPRDEEYWDRHRTTPKGFLPLEVGRTLWPLRQGSLTSVRVFPRTELVSAEARLEQELRLRLDPAEMGFSVVPVRAEGLAASRGATDFGEYFTYFSFFLVVSALLLAGLFFRLGVEQRRREIGVLQAVGFRARRVRRLFLAEGLILSALGSLLGLVLAIAYADLVLLGLTTWWVDAVGTRLLELHVALGPLLLGGLGGLLAAAVSVAVSLRGLRALSPRALLAGAGIDVGWGGASNVRTRAHILGLVSLLGSLFLVAGVFLGIVGEVAGFFGAGSLLLIATLTAQWIWLSGGRGRGGVRGSGAAAVSRLGIRYATYRPGRSLLAITLIAFATFIIVAVNAFRREGESVTGEPSSGTGGYPLLATSLLPIHWDPNSPEGREALNLAFPEDPLLSEIRFVPFRVRPGDDASCLNLYRPQNPRIVAPPRRFLEAGRFAFQNALGETENPWLLLDRREPEGAVPVIADANSMTYVLHVGVGDELVLPGTGDPPVRLRFVAALHDSIFQSELLMSEENFERLFPRHEGFRFFLLDLAPDHAEEATETLERRLSDYGFDVSRTAERLASYHRVENTYLSTFQTLGGLGLALGTFGLAAVLLRNLLERRRELGLLRAVGYRRADLALLVVTENAFLLLGGLVTGAVCAAVAVSPALYARGADFSPTSLSWLVSLVIASGLAASLVGVVAVVRAPLLETLRAE